jgi:hypothetical protein
MHKRALLHLAVGFGILLSASCAENDVPNANGGGADGGCDIGRIRATD